MGVKLRNVKIEDAPKVTEVAKKCTPWVRNSVTGTYEFLARCFQRYFFVLENDDKELVGYIVGLPNVDIEGEFWLYQVAVLENLREKGLGSMLTDAFKKQVIKDRYRVMKSHYIWKNEMSAALHAKFGFKRFGNDDRGPFVKCEI